MRPFVAKRDDDALRLASDESRCQSGSRAVLPGSRGSAPERGFRLTPLMGWREHHVTAPGICSGDVLRPTVQTPLTIYRDAADDHRAEVVEHMKLRWAQDDASILLS